MLSKADGKLIHALKSRSGREKHGLFVAEGVRVVEDLLAAGVDLEFAVVSTTLGDSARGVALRGALARATALREVDERAFAQVTDTDTSQGVLAVAHVPASGLADLRLAAAASLLVLDAVQDPGNLGTLVRTADAFGVTAVIALPGTTDFWAPKVIRSTAGAAFRRPLVNAGDEEVWGWLAQHDVAIYGADMDGDSIDAVELRGRLALVVGNEGAGLREQTRTHVARLVAIPMQGRIESLNVGVAAGILLYEFSRRQRRG